MADIKLEIALSKVLPRLGGVQGARKLETKCVEKIVSHPGDVVIITSYDFTLRLPNCKFGYRVFDERMQLRYAVAFDLSQADLYETYGADVRVPEFNFGYNSLDELWLSSVTKGDFFYIMYTFQSPATLDTHERIVLVVKTAAENQDQLPANTSRNILKGF